MKVLITGATGFIGNHVTRMCLEQGDDVRVMVMPGEDRSPLNGMDVEIVEGNLLNPESLSHCVEGVEGLYHLAAVYAIWTKDPHLHYKVNVEGAQAILKAAMTAGVKKVVYTSSIAALGMAKNGELITEETPFNVWDGNEYVYSKFMSHQMVKGLVGEGLPAVLVCPGLPFGPGDRMPTPTGGLIIAILKGEMKYYFPGGICAVDVRDVARGHLLAMEKGRVGESYMLANKDGNLTQRDLARLVGRIAGVADVATKELSPTMMRVVGRLMDAWSAVTGKAPKTTYKSSVYAMNEIFVDPSKAINELGLPQTPLETAITDATQWFRENGYV
ncbi:SDR family oxidoreductase [Oceanicoccus sp. KOV_DT_Chl]|uniref:SDR family oxidoreductase n=1 Tax=Oceanicoccus sp. KOV_DT_Chl TaxID=1904639 RepID=UPI000C7BFDC8|nr:SDR family oxidoreductase [Oceanicoccus sp. KOV_DT_Chl]